MPEWLFDYLPQRLIKDALENSDGDEIASGKIESPESSAALAVNMFGLFLENPAWLPPFPGTEAMGWPAKAVTIEQQVRFPWSGGRHPWLDAFVQTGTHIIGIESKRYEPFRSKPTGKFSDAYWRPVWGERMKGFERLRDTLDNGELVFRMFDGVQLVKHAFGIRTEAVKRGKKAALVYLFAEPSQWPDGRNVERERHEIHRAEARSFSEYLTGDEVSFSSCSYREWLKAFRSGSEITVMEHAENVTVKYDP